MNIKRLKQLVIAALVVPLFSGCAALNGALEKVSEPEKELPKISFEQPAEEPCCTEPLVEEKTVFVDEMVSECVNGIDLINYRSSCRTCGNFPVSVRADHKCGVGGSDRGKVE